MARLLLNGLKFEVTSVGTMLVVLWLNGDIDSIRMLYLCAAIHGMFVSLPFFGLLIESETEEDSAATFSSVRMFGGGITAGLFVAAPFIIFDRLDISLTFWSFAIAYVTSVGFHQLLYVATMAFAIKESDEEDGIGTTNNEW